MFKSFDALNLFVYLSFIKGYKLCVINLELIKEFNYGNDLF